MRSSLGKLAKNWSGCYTNASFGSDEIPKMGGGGGVAGSPTLVTSIHRLSIPPGFIGKSHGLRYTKIVLDKFCSAAQKTVYLQTVPYQLGFPYVTKHAK